MSDPYGIPDYIYGRIPDEFYGLVGRVVVLAALVEYQVLTLVWALDSEAPQAKHAGRPVAQLFAVGRQLLTTGEWEEALRDRGMELLGRAEGALKERNGVVHSNWPVVTTEAAFGWRPTRPGVSLDGDTFTSINTNRDELGALIRQLIQLVDDIGRFRDRGGINRPK